MEVLKKWEDHRALSNDEIELLCASILIMVQFHVIRVMTGSQMESGSVSPLVTASLL